MKPNKLLTPKYKERTHNEHKEHLTMYTKDHYDNIFIGDSMMWRWITTFKYEWDKTYKDNSANFGVGGDGVEHLLYRLKGPNTGFLDNIKTCKNLYLMIGTNNLGRDAPIKISEAISSIIQFIISKVKFERFVVFGVTYRSDIKNSLVDELNKYISDTCKSLIHTHQNTSIRYECFNNVLKDNDYADKVHLNVSGYKKWNDFICDIK